jgi:hypothetical protein
MGAVSEIESPATSVASAHADVASQPRGVAGAISRHPIIVAGVLAALTTNGVGTQHSGG